MSSRASSIRLGSYQLLERIGEGGTAHVYWATDAAGQPVAVKLLAPQAELDDAAARSRFEREIRALSALDHPGILPLLDSGFDDELGPYLVAPLVTGKTLRELLAGVRLCPEGAILVGRAVASAVAALHTAGLVHRDLKPENLLAFPDGRVMLFDLGLVYRAGQTRYTDEGAVVGSVPYMAPEQVDGQPVTPATDLWALAVMLYEWVVGRRPFERERPAEEAAAILVGSFAPLAAADRRVGGELDGLVADCLVRDAAARPTAAAALARLEAAVDWADPEDVGGELAALIADPAGYQDRVARFRVSRIEREARAAIDGGRAFAALKLIDRGLAYAPDDDGLRGLAEEAERADPRPAPAPIESAQPGRNRWLVGAVATAILGVVIAAIVLALVGGDDEPAPMRASPGLTVDRSPIVSDREAMELVGDFIGVFEKGIELEQEDRRRARIAEANQPDRATADPLAEVAPIPLDQLANDDPARPVGLAAPDGEPLVPVAILGGVDASAAIADFDRKHAAAPSDPEIAVGRALVYLAAGRTEAGLAQLARLAERHADSAAVWAALGFVELRRGRWTEADSALGRAIELDPKDGQSLRNRGILRSRQGRTRDAYLDLRRALTVSPGDREAARELYGIYLSAGREAEAGPLAR